MKIYSIDIRYVDSCETCGHLSVGMTSCTRKGFLVPEDMSIPLWCPLEDTSQPNKSTGQAPKCPRCEDAANKDERVGLGSLNI